MSAQSARSRIGAAGISIIVLLAAFGIYYFVYAERQTAYFAHRDLRILRTVTDQIAKSFDLLASINKDQPRAKTLDEVVAGLSGQTVLDVFDQVLIADQNGAVLWSSRGVEKISSIENFTTGGAWKKPEAIDMKALLPRGNHHEIVLHGDRYHLFTQPLKLSGDPRTYVLAGFVSATKFNRESLGISYTLILAVLAALLLTVLSMPYLKLKLIARLQRVRLSDVLVLAVCTMCTVSVLTIVLLDLGMYRRLRSECDLQLRHLAADINEHVHTEVSGALDALVYLDANLSRPRANERIPGPALASEQLRNYPYLQSFFRIDNSGKIAERWSAPNEPARGLGIDVSDRDYVKDLRFHREWVDPTHGKYTLSSIHSLSTAEAQAVVARHPVKPSPDNVAVGLGIPMMSLINTVVAGDCKYVVIDNDGQVQFHSEWQRNLSENFFDETDHDRALRAAVTGRQNEWIDIRYWGADQRAFVAPIPDTPWTVITFRDKVLLRTINVEMIMITVVFMILYGAVFVLLLATAALIRPSYRAPWLWPTQKRARDYQRLIYAFALLAIAFAVSIYCMRPKQLMIIALALPLIALLAMFLRLRRVKSVVALFGGFALLITAVAWLVATVSSDGVTEPDLFWPPRLMLLLSLFAGTAGIIAALLPPFTANDLKKPLGTPRFIALGGMLVLLLAILPTTAFFKAAYKIETESFVKYGQLRIANELEARAERIQKRAVDFGNGIPSPARLSENLDVYYDFFFHTDVRSMPFEDPEPPACTQRLKEVSILPPFLEPLLPKYSDQSVAMRELHHDSSRDDQWEWWRCGADLDLRVNSVHGPHSFLASTLPYLGFSLVDRTRAGLPYTKMFKAETHREDPELEHDGLTRAAGGVMLLFLLLAYVALILTMIRFMLQHVFLVDVRAPLQLAAGRNVLILARDRESAMSGIQIKDFISVEIAALKSNPHESWARIMTAIDGADLGKAVLITDFDTPAANADFGKLKLEFVERLIAHHGRNVVAITMTSPMTLLDEVADDPALHERWLAVFEQFDFEIEERRRTPRTERDDRPATLVRVLLRLTHAESLKRRAAFIVRADAFNGSDAHARMIVRREAKGVPLLRQIGKEILASGIRGEEEIYDELSERAAAYYSGLWSSCSKSEKVVLQNIATDGFANLKDRQVIRRLMTRCLVYRDPSLCVMNETFRRFVLGRRAECAALMEDSGASAWDKLQKPLAIAVACFAIFFFSTQREMFDVTMGVVTGLAGGIPAFLRIIGLFLDPKSAVKAGAGAS